MFQDEFHPYYHSQIKKYTALFGSLFNKISIKQLDVNGNEMKTIKVPIAFGPKEKYVAKISQSTPNRSVQMNLPRMTFEWNGFVYNAERQMNMNLKYVGYNSANNQLLYTVHEAVAYDIGFKLHIMTKNIEDGNQIVEQILPYFRPEFTPTIDNIIEHISEPKDIKILLNDVNPEIEYEGDFTELRQITWTFSFTMQAFFYGPVKPKKAIRKSIIGGLIDDRKNVILNVYNGNGGIFTLDDVVYQGQSMFDMKAVGNLQHATKFRSNTNYRQLVLTNVHGSFSLELPVYSTKGNATYAIASFGGVPEHVILLEVEPSPNTANANSLFGFTVTSNTNFGEGF